MVDLSLTIATQVQWPAYSAAHAPSIVDARIPYMQSAITEQKTDGLTVLTLDDAVPYISWIKWSDQNAANDYITFITQCATDANISSITTSTVDIADIPRDNVTYYQF